jgi:predicted CoA-binding protein
MREQSVDELAREFLSQRRIAVAGVSRDNQQAANLIFRKLRDTGRNVVAVNPRATEVEGAACYDTLAAIPEPVDAVVIATPPAVSDPAVAKCREHGIRVIAGACPMMFCEPVDFGHKCIRWIMKVSGRMPR